MAHVELRHAELASWPAARCPETSRNEPRTPRTAEPRHCVRTRPATAATCSTPPGGCSATTASSCGVEAVAREAGVGTGTLYRHFPSKDDLIAALIDRPVTPMCCAARRTPSPGVTAPGCGSSCTQRVRCRPTTKGCCTGCGRGPRRPGSPRSAAASGGSSTTRTATGRCAADVEQPDIVVVLHGLRGVIEANAGSDTPAAWERYLELRADRADRRAAVRLSS